MQKKGIDSAGVVREAILRQLTLRDRSPNAQSFDITAPLAAISPSEETYNYCESNRERKRFT
jgi:hypothetical protein